MTSSASLGGGASTNIEDQLSVRLEDTDNNVDGQAVLLTKVSDLFTECDIEQKGYISREDMSQIGQKLDLQLPPDKLNFVFDTLNKDKNGYLTLKEFSEGFSNYLGVTSSPMRHEQTAVNPGHVSLQCEEVYETHQTEDSAEDGEEKFTELLGNIGATEVLGHVVGIKTLWSQLHRDRPELLGMLEDFLHHVAGDLKRTHVDCKELETILQLKSAAHDEEVNKLYEEMDRQISAEKQRVISAEKVKDRQQKDSMKRELDEKNEQLNELLVDHDKMKTKLMELNSKEAETRLENEKLQQERKKLEEILRESQIQQKDSQSCTNELNSRRKEDKNEQVSTVLHSLHVSESVALERESLVKQLALLRSINKKLKDDNSLAELRRVGNYTPG